MQVLGIHAGVVACGRMWPYPTIVPRLGMRMSIERSIRQKANRPGRWRNKSILCWSRELFIHPQCSLFEISINCLTFHVAMMSFSDFKALATSPSPTRRDSDEDSSETFLEKDILFEYVERRRHGWWPALIHGCVLCLYTVIFLLSLQTLRVKMLHGADVVYSNSQWCHQMLMLMTGSTCEICHELRGTRIRYCKRFQQPVCWWAKTWAWWSLARAFAA